MCTRLLRRIICDIRTCIYVVISESYSTQTICMQSPFDGGSPLQRNIGFSLHAVNAKFATRSLTLAVTLFHCPGDVNFLKTDSLEILIGKLYSLLTDYMEGFLWGAPA